MAESEPTTTEKEGQTQQVQADEAAEQDDSTTQKADESASDKDPGEPFSAIIEAGTLQDAFNAVAVLVDECKVHLTPGGWEIRAVDAANVAMVELELPVPAFESYSGSGGILGVPLEKFQEAIGMANAGKLIQLAIDPETRKLNIQYEGLDFNMSLLDPDTIRKEPDKNSLDLNLPATVTLEGDDLTRGKKAADMVADHIRFTVDDEAQRFRINAQGDTDVVDFELDEDDLENLNAADASSIFSLDYISDVIRPIEHDGTVTLMLGNDFPVTIKYTLGEGTVEVRNLIAPRIENDD